MKGQRPRPLDDGDLVQLGKCRGASAGDRIQGELLACESRGMVPEEDVPMQRFEELVSLGLDAIPEGLARLMDNIAVFVEDQKPGRPNLLGLYEGIPLTKRGTGYSGALPDRITIFRLPILRVCSSEADVIRQVEVTVVHEVAHHFGISDKRLHELGAY